MDYELAGTTYSLTPYGAGKYDLLVDAYLDHSDVYDEQIGDVGTVGHYTLIRELSGSDVHNINRIGDDLSLYDLSEDDQEFLRAIKGAIIYENESGQVTVDYYGTAEELESMWAAAQEIVERFEENNQE